MLDFEKVYLDYFTDVYRYVYSLCLDHHLAEEITQETFFKALSKIDQYRGEAKIQVWLCQIAKNLYFSNLKESQKHLEFNEEIYYPSIETSLVDSDKVQKIHRYLHQLEEPYKEVFLLKTFGELSHLQIAEIFGKNENWARVTYYRARMKIKEKMK